MNWRRIFEKIAGGFSKIITFFRDLFSYFKFLIARAIGWPAFQGVYIGGRATNRRIHSIHKVVKYVAKSFLWGLYLIPPLICVVKLMALSIPLLSVSIYLAPMILAPLLSIPVWYFLKMDMTRLYEKHPILAATIDNFREMLQRILRRSILPSRVRPALPFDVRVKALLVCTVLLFTWLLPLVLVSGLVFWSIPSVVLLSLTTVAICPPVIVLIGLIGLAIKSYRQVKSVYQADLNESRESLTAETELVASSDTNKINEATPLLQPQQLIRRQPLIRRGNQGHNRNNNERRPCCLSATERDNIRHAMTQQHWDNILSHEYQSIDLFQRQGEHVEQMIFACSKSIILHYPTVTFEERPQVTNPQLEQGQQEQQAVNFLDMPEELLAKIFSCLKVPDLHKVDKVCLTFYRISRDECVWKTVLYRTLVPNEIELLRFFDEKAQQENSDINLPCHVPMSRFKMLLVQKLTYVQNLREDSRANQRPALAGLDEEDLFQRNVTYLRMGQLGLKPGYTPRLFKKRTIQNDPKFKSRSRRYDFISSQYDRHAFYGRGRQRSCPPIFIKRLREVEQRKLMRETLAEEPENLYTIPLR